MKKKLMKPISLLLIAIMTVSIAASTAVQASEVSSDDSYYPVTFTDMGGNEVTMEKAPEHIGALMGGTYEYITWCDPALAEKIDVSMILSDNEWRTLLTPSKPDMVMEMPKVNRDPNVEDLAARGIDTIFYWGDLDEIRERMESLGITVIECGSSDTDVPDTPEKIIKKDTAIYKMFGAALNCTEKAAAYEKYTSDMINMVAERTANLTDEERPSVYMVRSSVEGTQYFPWGGTYPYFAEIAGGKYVEHNDNASTVTADVTMEQIIEWDPEYVFVCWTNRTDGITESPEWSVVSAVKNDNVYLVPAADSAYLVSPLWILFMAQSMHPDLFEDIDFISEIQRYFSEFRDYDLTTEQATYIYNRLQPDGTPRPTDF